MIPQVCFPCDAVIAVNVRPPATAVGVSRLSVVPSPSCPASLFPQQYAGPLVAPALVEVTPHV
ncbi:hypothetical protein D3C83_198860 [compost metagenome]